MNKGHFVEIVKEDISISIVVNTARSRQDPRENYKPVRDIRNPLQR